MFPNDPVSYDVCRLQALVWQSFGRSACFRMPIRPVVGWPAGENIRDDRMEILLIGSAPGLSLVLIRVPEPPAAPAPRLPNPRKKSPPCVYPGVLLPLRG